ncbi:MAG: voltage-gated potassium channel [Lentimonas sp.]
MGFTLTFLEFFFRGLLYSSPILLFLALLITSLGLWIGRKEAWPVVDATYFAFITATTVGYGDFHPKHTACKYVAIIIALIGVLFTGIIVATGLYAVETAFTEIHGLKAN